MKRIIIRLIIAIVYAGVMALLVWHYLFFGMFAVGVTLPRMLDRRRRV